MPPQLVLTAVAALAIAWPVIVRPAGAADPAAPAAATIRGRVEVRLPDPAASPRPGVADLGADPDYRPGGERREAVVYFESAPQAAFEAAPDSHATMGQTHETFVPHVLAVRVGTVVDFPNNDPIFHNVFSFSKVKRFDLGRYPKGRSRSVRFDEPGIVRVFCEIHSHMNAFILVFAHRFFCVTDAHGRYHIDQVPAGTYTLVAWYEGSVRQARPVTVPSSGGTLGLDFSLR